MCDPSFQGVSRASHSPNPMSKHLSALVAIAALCFAPAATALPSAQQTQKRQLVDQKQRKLIELATFTEQWNNTLKALQDAGAAIDPRNARYALAMANAIDTFVYVYESTLEDTVKSGAEAAGNQFDIDGVALHDAVVSAVEGLSQGLKAWDDFVQDPTLDNGINNTKQVIDIIDDNKDTAPLFIGSIAKVFGCA